MKAIVLVTFMSILMCSTSQNELPESRKAKVSYSDFETLVKEVKNHRKKRLVDCNTFLSKSTKDNVIILDTRSKDMYDKKHIKGAVHLNFSDFTQANLAALIPNKDTTILIYCNNNFEGDQIHFATKSLIVKPSEKDKEITLALNIPTYINLYGYGYKNVYELSELISAFDQRIAFEGTTITPITSTN
ncbi:rhodanese-like domain-containing protein [Psychroserpens sp. SPM9]|uniref:rhodanese-like domain-containing protein n=1 Tax=Psychroserpens sp. SPM9 TaxID=2975598 RepID=UPI0021A862CA|nr:rhodanese-like domain-containing protein [Psychroserpens sp. SPM9]MDG5492881.1 rhodanese-like domain-containing protein [Psychroserpens sp. SPM9]